jgi:hypothetical protein
VNDGAPLTKPVQDYKRILQRLLDNRPSGTRQRLATALGTNRSFVSQMANPAYAMPIPSQHLEAIFEVCHFSQADRSAFLNAYAQAHPDRLESARARSRVITLTVPDLGDGERNRRLEEALARLARDLARLAEGS